MINVSIMTSVNALSFAVNKSCLVSLIYGNVACILLHFTRMTEVRTELQARAYTVVCSVAVGEKTPWPMPRAAAHKAQGFPSMISAYAKIA